MTAASDGLAILVDRHQRKGGGVVGEGARGSSQFTHGVDIIVSLSRSAEKNLGPNVRVIEALSRFDETPEKFLIELTDYGYVPVDTTGQSDTTRQQAEQKILEILPSNEGDAMTAAQIFKEIPSVGRTLLYQSLETLIRDQKVLRFGAGVRGNPYRHHQPSHDGQKEGMNYRYEDDGDSSARTRPPYTYTSRTNRFDSSIRRDSSETSADELPQQALSFTGGSDDSSACDSFGGREFSNKSSKRARFETTNFQKQSAVCDACGCREIVDNCCVACGALLGERVD